MKLISCVELMSDHYTVESAHMKNRSIEKSIALAGLGALTLGITGCAALVVGSVVGAGGLAGYEYVNTSAPTSQAQPSTQPKLSLNDIE